MDKYTRSRSKKIKQTASSKEPDVEVIEMVEDGRARDGKSRRSGTEKRLQEEVTNTETNAHGKNKKVKKSKTKLIKSTEKLQISDVWSQPQVSNVGSPKTQELGVSSPKSSDSSTSSHRSQGLNVESLLSKVESPESEEETYQISEEDVSNSQTDYDTADSRTENTFVEFQSERLVDVEGGRLLILESGQEVSLSGFCTMSVLCGSAEVFGYHCDPSKQPVELFSAVSNSLLKIKCLSVETNSDCVRSVYSENRLEQDVADCLPCSDVAVIKLGRLDAPHIDYVTTLNTFKQLFCGIKDGPLGRFSVESNQSKRLPQLHLSNDHYFVLDKWKEQLSKDPASILITCGGKGQGKSTLTQFLLNSTLNVLDKVCYLDCDPGQTEFTPPGSLSLHTITNPALGPPFSHQKEPAVWCFNGNVSPNGNPHLYLNCIRQCFHGYTQMKPRPPLVVNTMGWISGLGLLLLIDTLRIVQPDLVIQIDSKHADGNLPMLTPTNVAQSDSWSSQCKEQQKNIPQKDHSVLIINSVVDTKSGNYSRARHLRDMALLSYLTKGLPEGLMAAKPCMVSWSTIAIHVCHATVPSSQILEAINACVVALCCLDDEHQRYREGEDSPWLLKKTPVCDCVGYGFVRGIDKEKKCLYIVSPVPLSKLKSVNLLMRGNVNLTEDLFLKAFPGVVPYVDITATTKGSGALRQRKRMPRKT
ncbi:polynucleotide 5'-hydroxyl-kinase NOL9-like [Mizuhopecten yessoensis]|uniref:Polynucleotide 5'-hydroxyl-kinase NOL9 n=1 Tax=Mizuhopecten yessoensis TaxID=6573 RepID=A0A210PZS0_MIZYE|nr:polynucleotide 5'-hydroxyl-kinase NOL9-like [Mizuhopecten yessoensis]XP_021371042.1 polynucleotide 5'-hydroxyl-kinase NOL9-like [Mizuhopecten yessoensis]OWF41990.1 Polynucleotide 5'-hydroxyl-kinase NOL9 [Mizuhopecten yessoensis]